MDGLRVFHCCLENDGQLLARLEELRLPPLGRNQTRPPNCLAMLLRFSSQEAQLSTADAEQDAVQLLNAQLKLLLVAAAARLVASCTPLSRTTTKTTAHGGREGDKRILMPIAQPKLNLNNEEVHYHQRRRPETTEEEEEREEMEEENADGQHCSFF